ncbi:MAG: hypothetical protein RJA52_484 [Bacteroidota bacterium]|jgi:uncharacterized protein YdhG (YjbR/CyaY superfamily)
MKTGVKTIDEYLIDFPEEVQIKLEQIRELGRLLCPNAKEAIKYGIPTFVEKGNLFHFAAYPTHIGFYPGSEVIQVFAKNLKPYKTGKGTVQFPLDKPLPLDLIEQMIHFRTVS